MTETAHNMNETAREVTLVLPGSWTMVNRDASRIDAVTHWLLEFIVSGAIQFRAPSLSWVTFETGKGILYAPGIPHDERVQRGECRSIGIFFDVHSETLFRRLAGEHGIRPILDADGRLISRLKLLHDIHNIGDAEGYGTHGCLCILVWTLLASPEKDGWIVVPEWPSVLPEPVLRANAYMREHMHERPSINDICSNVGLSASGLHHAYRRATGESPMAALRMMRIDVARGLLLRSGMTLEQIAAKTGFADAFHLSRVFRQLTGESPRSFRKSKAM